MFSLHFRHWQEVGQKITSTYSNWNETWNRYCTSVNPYFCYTHSQCQAYDLYKTPQRQYQYLETIEYDLKCFLSYHASQLQLRKAFIIFTSFKLMLLFSQTKHLSTTQLFNKKCVIFFLNLRAHIFSRKKKFSLFNWVDVAEKLGKALNVSVTLVYCLYKKQGDILP